MTAKQEESLSPAPVPRPGRQRRRLKVAVLTLAILLFLAANGLTFLQAYALTHYATSGHRTASPDKLSWSDKARLLFTGATVPRPKDKHTPLRYLMFYSTHHFRSTDGTRLEGWYISHADAPAVVLLFHGYAGAKSSLLPHAQALHRMGLSTFLVDFRGSGGSDGDETSLGYYEADDVAATCAYVKTLAPGCPQILYGSSMGAAAILRAVACKGVHPAGIILESCFNRLLATIGNRFTLLGVPSFPFAAMLVFWGGLQHGFWGFGLNPDDYARSVSCPVLMLQGGRDRRVTDPQARDLYAHFKCPKQIEIFGSAGHGGCLKKNRRRWVRVVGGFIHRCEDKALEEAR